MTRPPGVAFVLLPFALAGCSGSSALPSAPSPTPIAGAAREISRPESTLDDVTLSGVVYEVISESPRRIAGIEGVAVYCEQCGESTHNWAYTNSNGEYVFPRGVWTEGRPGFPVRVSVQKDGYGDPPGLATTPPNPSGPGWREVVITGNTRFEIELRRR